MFDVPRSKLPKLARFLKSPVSENLQKHLVTDLEGHLSPVLISIDLLSVPGGSNPLADESYLLGHLGDQLRSVSAAGASVTKRCNSELEVSISGLECSLLNV